MVVLAGACSSDDDAPDGDTADDDGSRFAVTVVAGGGEQTPSESGVQGVESRLQGRLTSLSFTGDGAIWAILGEESLIEIDGDGQVRMWTPELPDGAEGIADLAVGADGSVHLLLDGAPTDAAVHVWDADAGLRPAFGVPVPGDQLGESLPESPDGTPAVDAPVGPIDDITVDDAGRLVFVEKLGVDGYRSPRLVRRVEDDHLVTIAGAPTDAGAAQPSTGEVRAASFPDDGADATASPVLGPTLLGAAADGRLLLQFVHGAAFLEDDGTLTPAIGAMDGDLTVPRTPESGPLTDAHLAQQVEFRSTTSASPSVSADGSILATTTGGVPSDQDERAAYLWDVQDGPDGAQAIADAAADDRDAIGAVYVAPSGELTTATLIGTGATLRDDDTIAVAAADPETGDSIVVTFPVSDDAS